MFDRKVIEKSGGVALIESTLSDGSKVYDINIGIHENGVSSIELNCIGFKEAIAMFMAMHTSYIGIEVIPSD